MNFTCQESWSDFSYVKYFSDPPQPLLSTRASPAIASLFSSNSNKVRAAGIITCEIQTAEVCIKNQRPSTMRSFGFMPKMLKVVVFHLSQRLCIHTFYSGEKKPHIFLFSILNTYFYIYIHILYDPTSLLYTSVCSGKKKKDELFLERQTELNDGDFLKRSKEMLYHY